MDNGGGGGEKSGDFHSVLGLNKECSETDLRNAYKKLAMRWHPDRCSASGKSKLEAKERFQKIQEAYSVLSDSDKRFLYDVGIYDNDDDQNGMGDFLGELAQMMCQTKPDENGHESLEELQKLFVEIFQPDLGPELGGPSSSYGTNGCDSSSRNGNIGCNKRDISAMGSGKPDTGGFVSGWDGFCLGSNDSGSSSKGRRGGDSKRRNGRKQKVSSKHDVSSEISAA